MSTVRPRTGFHLAWRGELDAEEINAGISTRRHLEPLLDALDEIESSLGAQPLPSSSWEWSSITPELLDRIRSGLWEL